MAFKYITVATILVLGAFVQSSLASCGCNSGCGSSSGSGNGWAISGSPVYREEVSCGGGSGSGSGSGSAWGISGSPVYRVASGCDNSCSGSSSGSGSAKWAIVSSGSSANSNADSCNQCGYIRVPDEAPRRVQIIRTGPAPSAPAQSLPYQVQVPVQVQTPSSCGQQYGVRVEAAPRRAQICTQSLAPMPYVVEVPREAPSCQLKPLPIKVTAHVAPKPKPQVLYNIGYAVEVPAQNSCAPKLCNLKAQVDRIVLPNTNCPCPSDNDYPSGGEGECPPNTPSVAEYTSSIYSGNSGNCGSSGGYGSSSDSYGSSCGSYGSSSGSYGLSSGSCGCA